MSLSAFGKYRVVQKIGAGGFGEVYEGLDPHLNRRVAIKTCSSNDQELRLRFTREAEIAANLRHPNIVTIFDFGHQDGTPYLVQEYLTGEDLDHKIKRRERLDEATIREVLKQIASGLKYAHSRDVVHRDIKPANIRILDDGQVRIMDFGIAKLLSAQTQLTRTGMALGTAAYLPPEQIMGKTLDQRADQFSFGVLAYELITGVRPFSGDSMSTILYAIAHKQPESVANQCPGCPPRLATLIETCLAKDPDDRFAGFGEIIAELDGLATRTIATVPTVPAAVPLVPAAVPPPLPSPEPTAAESLAPTRQLPVEGQEAPNVRNTTSRKLWIGLLAAAVILALGIGALLVTRSGQGPGETAVTADTSPAARDAAAEDASVPSQPPEPEDRVVEVTETPADTPDQVAATEAPEPPASSSTDTRPRPPRTSAPAEPSAAQEPPDPVTGSDPGPELDAFPEPASDEAEADESAPAESEPLLSEIPVGLGLGRLAPGQPVYADRPFTYESVPEAYLDLPCLLTKNDFKDIKTSFELELSRESDIFVAHDERLKHKPDWLKEFRNTGDRLTVLEIGDKPKTVGYEIFVKSFPSGRVTLGENKPRQARKKRVSMYVVFVRAH